MSEEQHQRRRHQRLRLRAAARLLDNDEVEFAFTENLSTGGFFIRDVQHLRIGDLVELELILPDDDKPFQIQAEVRHIREPGDADLPGLPAGTGFAFVEGGPALYEALDDVMDRLGERQSACVLAQDEDARAYLSRAGFKVLEAPSPELCKQVIANSELPVVGVIVSHEDRARYAKAIDADAVFGLDDPDDMGEILSALDLRVLAI